MSQFIVVVEVHSQCSADYASVKSTQTKVFDGDATLDEVKQWTSQFRKHLGIGDVILTEPQP